MHHIYKDNDNLIRVRGLKDRTDDSYVNSATINLVLKDEDGAQVAGVAWPVSATYVTASNGDYNGILPKEAAIAPKTSYYVEITAVDGAVQAEWNLRVMAVDRRL